MANTKNSIFGSWRLFLLPLLIPALIALAIYHFLPSSKKARTRTPQEVAKILRNFITDSGGEWDWDDFISVPISDAELEAIRLDAGAVPLPVNEAGLAKLRELLDRVNSLSK
jgi:hypothetical protein